MRILIDECVDPRVKLLFSGHLAATVHDKEWAALEDGPLLALAQKEFDVLVTIDGGLERQQNLANFQNRRRDRPRSQEPARPLPHSRERVAHGCGEGSRRRSHSCQGSAGLTPKRRNDESRS